MARLQAKDGEYKKQDLVTIEMDAFRAMLFAPQKLKAKTTAMPGILAQARDDIVEEQYIVTVRRIQGTWEYTIRHDGQEIKLPAEVIDRIIKSRDLIISRGRKDAARNRMQRVAADDQAATAREPDDPASAMAFLGTVRRIQGTWEYTIRHDGQEIKLPAEVIDRIIKSRDLIISRGRKDAARNRMQRVAADDQAAAAREPDDPASAMAFLEVDDEDDRE